MKKYRGFFAGMVTMLLIVTMCGTAIATVGKVTKELEYRNIKVSLDGKILDLKDAAGNSVEPFMFDGTNYLPVRALAEALGLQVAWDSSTSTVVLTTPEDALTEHPEQIPSVDELLFAKEQVRFYYTGYEKTDIGYNINLRIENDSDYSITGRVLDTSISGKNVDMTLQCETEPGRISDGKIMISNTALKKAGITTDFRIIKLRFAIRDAKNLPYLIDFETGPLSIALK